jgi:hypothetical protein
MQPVALLLVYFSPTLSMLNGWAKTVEGMVRQNFLITRYLKEYLLLFLSLYYPEDIVYL